MHAISDEIKEWIMKQDGWVRMLCIYIAENGTLSDEQLEEIYNEFKIQYNFVKSESGRTFNDLDIDDSKLTTLADDNTNTYTLSKVSNVSNVNALKNNQHLIINEGLNLIYGRNGSGKSGYTRLFNNVFLSRGDKKIIPNIYADIEDNHTFSANFSFSNSDPITSEVTEELVTYPDDNSHYYNKVAVFDSHSVNTILNDETQISFAPIEFSFFDKLSQYYDLIKKKYYADKKEVENKNEIFHDRFKATFSSKSDIGKVVNELNKNKNIDDIINVSRITEEDNNKNDAAIKRKGEIISLDIEKNH